MAVVYFAHLQCNTAKNSSPQCAPGCWSSIDKHGLQHPWVHSPCSSVPQRCALRAWSSSWYAIIQASRASYTVKVMAADGAACRQCGQENFVQHKPRTCHVGAVQCSVSVGPQASLATLHGSPSGRSHYRTPGYCQPALEINMWLVLRGNGGSLPGVVPWDIPPAHPLTLSVFSALGRGDTH
jgi:hypothetical protein